MEKENKTLNLCEKLAGCPKGTKLWSPLFGECEFVALGEDMDIRYPDDSFVVRCDEMGNTFFDKHGHYFSSSEECLIFPSRENRDWDSWDCPKPKVQVKRFDPKTFQPFDKVLVRDNSGQIWFPALFSWREVDDYYSVGLIGQTSSRRAVPYNKDTKHLLGTSNEAPEYYRWWEEK